MSALVKLPKDDQAARFVAQTALAMMSKRLLTDSIETCEHRADAIERDHGTNDDVQAWRAAAETFWSERRRRY